MMTSELKKMVAECIRKINREGHNDAGYRVVQSWIDTLPISDRERANVVESARQQSTISQPSRAKYVEMTGV